jgi:hypothetical protein
MRLHDAVHVRLDAQARPLRHGDLAADDLQRLARQALAAFLPDPVGVDGRDLARRRRRAVGEHRQRHVEVVVRVRAPGQAPVGAELGQAHRTLHGPEVRIGQRDVDRAQQVRVGHLAPVGGDHVGGGADAGGALEFGHDLAARVAVLRPARIFGIGQHLALAAAGGDRFGQRPGAVRIQRGARVREAALDRGDCRHFVLGAHHAALQLEVAEAVFVDGGRGQLGDRFRAQGFAVAQPVPAVAFAAIVGQVGALAVADVEQIGQHGDVAALLAVAEQFAQRHAEVLAEQVEQGGLHRRDHVLHAQVDFVRLLHDGRFGARGDLMAGAGNRRAQPVQAAVVAPDFGADDQRHQPFQGLQDAVRAGHLAHAGMPGAVFEQHQDAGEMRCVGAAQVEQHAVAPGNGNDLHACDDGGIHGIVSLFISWHAQEI